MLYHNAYHATLDDDFKIQHSQEYFECENQRIVNFQRTLEEWFSREESEINPHDSVSNTGSRSHTRTSCSKSSHTSLHSSAANPQTIPGTKRALLTAEAAALCEQQNLQEEELWLKQQQEEPDYALNNASSNSSSKRKLLRWRPKSKSTLWLNKETITFNKHSP